MNKLFLTTLFCQSFVIALPSNAVEAPAPFGAIPSERQVAWQRMEYYGFVHLGLNTWTDREWGYGDEDEKLFNPSSFDATAIVRQLKGAGMEGVILTAKHHDGFCLWPTNTTDHSISRSPWKNGKGDLLKEFSEACQTENFKFGIYVSPWDRNHAEYARDGYVRDYHEQIREVVTDYGPLFEIWFDRANGGDGYYGGVNEKRTIPAGYYQFPKVVEMIRKRQPNCIIWSAGDARWGGSEAGHVKYPHWHTMDSKKRGEGASGIRHGDTWLPAEGDTSIRPGWFWHEREDRKVKSPGQLLKVWFDCVGRGANLILNVPPDRDGKLRGPDISSLMGFRALRDSLYSTDFAAKSRTKGPSRGGDPKFASANLTDDDLESYWATDDDDTSPAAEVFLAKSSTFDVIRLREQIRLGQRVDAFAIDAWLDDGWKEVHIGQTIGNQVLIRLARPVTSDRLRLRITACPAAPCITELSLFKMPFVQEPTAKVPEMNAVSKSEWKIISTSFGPVQNAIDENSGTFWHTGIGKEHNSPQSLTVDFSREYEVSAITFLPRQDGNVQGMTDQYRFELSRDGKSWQIMGEGEFSNIKANPIEQIIPLKVPTHARYLRFTGLRAVDGNGISAAEIGITVPH